MSKCHSKIQTGSIIILGGIIIILDSLMISTNSADQNGGRVIQLSQFIYHLYFLKKKLLYYCDERFSKTILPVYTHYITL